MARRKGNTVEVERKQSNPWIFVSILLGVLLIACFSTNIYLVSALAKNRNTLAAPSAQNAPSQQQAGAVAPSAPTNNVAQVDGSDDPFVGSETAPVTIIEFSDFQCPFCERFHTQTYPQLKAEYIDTGKVKFVYRDFPLGFHPQAKNAAEAAECANEQGKFWQYHDKIFENQASLSATNFKAWAKDLGFDMTAFNNCFDSGKYADEVEQDLRDGTAAGVSGTPTFFVNGQKLVGAQPYEAFKPVIDAELAK